MVFILCCDGREGLPWDGMSMSQGEGRDPPSLDVHGPFLGFPVLVLGITIYMYYRSFFFYISNASSYSLLLHKMLVRTELV